MFFRKTGGFPYCILLIKKDNTKMSGGTAITDEHELRAFRVKGS
jgi:hypothetical protein